MSDSSDDERTAPPISCIAMYSSQREFDMDTDPEPDPAQSDPDLLNPQNRTALDAAVVENIMHANIHKLADSLHTEGSREKFMAWLWELADFNGSGVVTLEELRVFLAALSEDAIDLEELAFYRHDGEPLEVCIINEFDTTHAGLLSRDEFMVLADLVTREYEFWENRHLDRIGDYELGRTIGRGSSGVVRLAMHVESRKKFAVKIIKKGKCSDLSRLDREIQSLMAAKHENIVALEEVLDSDNNIFIVMELCGGGSMVDIVRLYPEERMPEETARFFVRQVFDALAFCHGQGICHRDVRLDNLMLDNSGNVKITDFGHSGMYTPGWDLFSTALVGSVYNLSPEQILGQLYSGEKIDIWSAGVAVYCLLVGRPPFFEPEVNALLESITACRFEVPDFVSANAGDLIRCMVRASPDERISMQQMLHHPWFYDGPEYGPSMNVVVFPVDLFFRKRPDIAEMILAITIYQHSLHFHLADTQNPMSSPEDQRGQDWTLKCLCPKNDIKFTVSLFTQSPHDVAKKKQNGQMVSRMSSSSLADTTPAVATVAGSGRVGEAGSSLHGRNGLRRSGSTLAPSSPIATGPEIIRTPVPRRSSSNRDGEPSASRPPLQKKIYKVTPMDVAAHIRESTKKSEAEVEGDVFDFEADSNNEEFAVQSFREELLRREDGDYWLPRSVMRGRSHVRSHSLEEPDDVRRINRSATVDAFPYHKVIPKRPMPDSARNLNFDKPVGSAGVDDSREMNADVEVTVMSAPLTPTMRSEGSFGSASQGEDTPRSPGGDRRSVELQIAQSLFRHPSKVMSPQVRRNSDEMVCGEGGTPLPPPLSVSRRQAEMQPFIEVRLLDGESGLFLKICRKLKNICSTKLAAAAERQRKKTCGRRSLSALRRTASARSMDSESDVTAESGEARKTVRCETSRAESKAIVEGSDEKEYGISG